MNITKFENNYRLTNLIDKAIIDDKIEEFIKNFVLCNKCGNPETKNNKRNRCKACGFKNYFDF